MIVYIFWSSFLFIMYAYLGYPLSLWFLQLISSKDTKKSPPLVWPKVTVVIAAKNESQNIDKRLENIMGQDYDGPVIEVIVVSDGSEDETVLKVEKAAAENVEGDRVRLRLIKFDESKGKPAALNIAVSEANGEIIVFADARQSFSRNAIKELVTNFSDSSIGGVSGELLFVESDHRHLTVEMGAYWKYEKIIRKLESDSGSVMGATGAIYAIRKNLYKPISTETLLDDVLIPINVVSSNYRVVFDSQAIAYDVVSKNIGGEWKRKVRTLAGNWQLIGNYGVLWKAIKHHFFYRYFWHKVARLLVPMCLFVVFFMSYLLQGTIYSILFGIQCVFYIVALVAGIVPFIRENQYIKLCYFFCVLNAAAIVGFWTWLSGGCEDAWKSNAPNGDEK